MRIADTLGGKRYPIHGVPVENLIAALVLVGSSPEVGRARILQIEPLPDDHLLVTTGSVTGMRAGAGKTVLLRRNEHTWEIVEVGTWRA